MRNRKKNTLQFSFSAACEKQGYLLIVVIGF